MFAATANRESDAVENAEKKKKALFKDYLKAAEESIVVASTEYGTHIHASVEKGIVFACQFHPEKSSDVGLQILRNFVEI